LSLPNLLPLLGQLWSELLARRKVGCHRDTLWISKRRLGRDSKQNLFTSGSIAAQPFDRAQGRLFENREGWGILSCGGSNKRGPAPDLRECENVYYGFSSDFVREILVASSTSEADPNMHPANECAASNCHRRGVLEL
jgi:hypothetical protein